MKTPVYKNRVLVEAMISYKIVALIEALMVYEIVSELRH